MYQNNEQNHLLIDNFVFYFLQLDNSSDIVGKVSTNKLTTWLQQIIILVFIHTVNNEWSSYFHMLITCITWYELFISRLMSWSALNTCLFVCVFQGRERSSPDHRRYSMLDPSALDSEVTRLRQRLLSTEDALRNALEHNQQVDQLVQAMRKHPEKSPVKLITRTVLCLWKGAWEDRTCIRQGAL